MEIDAAFNKEKFCLGCLATHSLQAYLLRLLFAPTLSGVVVQLLTLVWFFATPRTAAHQASLSIPNSQGLLTLMSTESVMLSISSFVVSFCPFASMQIGLFAWKL